jgi:hypothetical protein
MDTYFPYLDIVDTQGFKDETWGYATISTSGTDANGHLPGKYGVELDLNKDGRGEWLILVPNPASTEWTTQGVQAWNDANGDVGGGTQLLRMKLNRATATRSWYSIRPEETRPAMPGSGSQPMIHGQLPLLSLSQ